MTTPRSSRNKHSFIQFYFDDWKGATSALPRLVRSVLFDVCMFNWDKRRPLSRSGQMMMFGDLENWPQIIDALVEVELLEADDTGSIHSPRAIREGERAFSAWEAKSKGGKGRAEQRWGGKNKDSYSSPDSTPTGELQQSYQLPDADSDSDSDSDSETDSESEDSVLSGLVIGPEQVANAWNEMASKSGLAQIKTMTNERQKKLNVRLKEHGGAAIIEGINTIPDNAFLMGENERQWKANFDWLLRPDACAKLIEGGYQQGKGRPSAWTE